MKESNATVGLRDWGYPGYLTEDEFAVFESFRQEVFSEGRTDNFRSTVFSFDRAKEEVPYALCRWLRARKYNLADTIKMVEEAMECTNAPRRHNFYPDPSAALSVERSLYIKQYPQIYYGHAKNGCPVFISQPGRLNIEAIGCLTSIPSIINFHWHAMMHEFVDALYSQHKTSDGKFKRYECVCILDLAHLTPSKVGKRQLNIIKVQSTIDSLCFPETLNKMVIVNAPGFFSMTWKLIRGWIDQRTASKVEVVGTGKEKLFKKLSNFIDPDELPSDYGGNGTSIADILKKDMLYVAESERQVGSRLKLEDEEPCLISFKCHTSRVLTVQNHKAVKLSFFTRTLVGCKNIVNQLGNNDKVLSYIDVVHHGVDEDDENEIPTRYNLEDYGVILYGPKKYEIEFKSNGGRYKQIVIMMSTKTYVVDDVKILVSEKDESIPQATVSTITGNTSICTGIFSPTDSQNLLVKASPHVERRMAILAKRQAKRNCNDSQDPIEIDNDDCYAGVPRVKRVTSKIHDTSSLQSLKKEMSTLGPNYAICDSPQRPQPMLCDLFQNPCD